MGMGPNCPAGVADKALVIVYLHKFTPYIAQWAIQPPYPYKHLTAV